MKRLAILLFAAVSCREKSESTEPTLPEISDPSFHPSVSMAPRDAARSVDSTLPGPARAAAAAARVRPLLETDLRKKGLHFGDPVFLRAFKEENELEIWMRDRETGRFRHFRTYPVAAASGELGPKLSEGDGQVPEGFYRVDRDAFKPDSDFHLAFNIGYPNAFDRAHSRTGSFIMIHGRDRSIGCLAMTDPLIEEIYTLCAAALEEGQPSFQVHVFPFRMTDNRMARAADNEWFAFWTNLRVGFDRFEESHIPPRVTVDEGNYTFSKPDDDQE